MPATPPPQQGGSQTGRGRMLTRLVQHGIPGVIASTGVFRRVRDSVRIHPT